MKIKDYEYTLFSKAPIIKRFGAQIIDALIFLPFSIFLYIIISRNYDFAVILVGNIIISSLYLLYCIFMYIKFNATLGKKVFLLKLISTDNTKIEKYQIFKRMIFILLFEIHRIIFSTIQVNYNLNLEGIRKNIVNTDFDSELINQYFEFYELNPSHDIIFVSIALLPIVLWLINAIIFLRKGRYRGMDDIISSTVLISETGKNTNGT